MYIQELQNKLIALARERVKAGMVTERALARMADISQPHMHNVLKHTRMFSSQSCDRLMRALDLRVSDLLWHAPEGADARIHAVPFVEGRIGPGTGTALTSVRGHMPVAGWLVKGLVDPLTVRLAADLVMPSALARNDLVLLDQNPLVRAAPYEGSIWIVETESGLRARYVRWDSTHVYAGNELTRADPRGWTAVPLQRRNILDVVRARIVWIGREMETQPAGPVEPAGESHRSDH